MVTNNHQGGISVPCGNCMSCRLRRARDWSIRSQHEASLHEKNTFITLTYAPEHLPEGGILRKDHLQKFLKRLRRHSNQDVRYFACGEYGEQYARPHYHLCLFGKDFENKEALSKTRQGNILYRSPELETYWKYGFSTIGELNRQTAGYTARYVLKKINGKLGEETPYPERLDTDTGELTQVKEFQTSSLKPGIGRKWIEKYYSDVYASDAIIIDGKKYKPPRFYDKVLAEIDPDWHQRIQAERVAFAESHADDDTESRLSQRAIVQKSRATKLIRHLENDQENL